MNDLEQWKLDLENYYRNLFFMDPTHKDDWEEAARQAAESQYQTELLKRQTSVNLPEITVTASNPTKTVATESDWDPGYSQFMSGERYYADQDHKNYLDLLRNDMTNSIRETTDKWGKGIGLGMTALATLPVASGVAAGINTGLNAFKAAHPLFFNAAKTGLDIAFTADGIRNALSNNGVLKTYRIGKDIYLNGLTGGKAWDFTKSLTGDALDIIGGVDLIKGAVKTGKRLINSGEQFIEGVGKSRIDPQQAFGLTEDVIKLFPTSKKMYLGFVKENNKLLSTIGEKLDRIVPDQYRKQIAKWYPTPSFRLNLADMTAYNDGVDFLRNDVLKRLNNLHADYRFELPDYVEHPLYMGRAESIVSPTTAGYHFLSRNGSYITLSPNTANDIASTAVHEGRHALLANTPIESLTPTDRINRLLELAYGKNKYKFDEKLGKIIPTSADIPSLTLDEIFEVLADMSIHNNIPNQSYTPELIHALHDLFRPDFARFRESSNLVEKGATTSELRYNISRQTNGLTGKDLDDYIEKMNGNDITNLLARTNGYGSDYYVSALKMGRINQLNNGIKDLLKIPMFAGVAYAGIKGVNAHNHLTNDRLQNNNPGLYYKSGGKFNCCVQGDLLKFITR